MLPNNEFSSPLFFYFYSKFLELVVGLSFYLIIKWFSIKLPETAYKGYFLNDPWKLFCLLFESLSLSFIWWVSILVFSLWFLLGTPFKGFNCLRLRYEGSNIEKFMIKEERSKYPSFFEISEFFSFESFYSIWLDILLISCFFILLL